jgi:four helix bundle protein
LKVWEKAHQLTLDVYKSTKAFPREENYGLCAQMRRACASIPTNIAEGCGRDGRAELARFLQIAMGSASELEYQLLLARDLRILDCGAFIRHSSDLEQIKRMLASYIHKIRTVRSDV